MNGDDFEVSGIPGVRFRMTFKADVLGDLDVPIREAVERALDAKVGYSVMPFGQVCLVAVSDAFEGQDGDVREAAVRRAIASVGSDASRRISSVLALTREEDTDLRQWRPALERIAEALQSRLGGDIGYVVFAGLERRTIIVALPHDAGLVTLVFSPEYLAGVSRDIHAAAGQLYEVGVFTFLGTALAGQRRIVDVAGVTEEGV